jgi:hypothetical protein
VRRVTPCSRLLAGTAFVGVAFLAGCAGHHTEQNRISKVSGTVKTSSTWRCHGPVDLDLLQVRIANWKHDAVHLNRGCTGVIREIDVVGDGGDTGPSADGIKVHAGVHDLKILSGRIDCGRKAPGAHQDAIQVMGGKRVTFARIESRGCANSFMFINWGRRQKEKPEDVVCEYCRAATNNFSVSVRNSIRSGALGGQYSSRVPPRATATATEPVLKDNAWRRRRGASR